VSHADPFGKSEPIDEWAAHVGLTPKVNGAHGNGNGAAVLDRPALPAAKVLPPVRIAAPSAEGVREMVQGLLLARDWNPKRHFAPAEVAFLVRETGQEEGRVRKALRELRAQAREQATSENPGAAPVPAGSDARESARALAVHLAGELVLLADGTDRDLLLKAAELTLAALD